MIRSQVYIPERIHQKIAFLAKKKGISMAEIIREFLRQGVARETKREQNDLYKLAELNISGGPTDLSKKMNKYLYGEG